MKAMKPIQEKTNGDGVPMSTALDQDGAQQNP